ncbi:hypothetical protein Tco_0027878, partial [Tanacetum coccineum]
LHHEYSFPEQLNVDRREFADAVNALTKFVFLKYQDVRLEFDMPLIFRLARRYSTLESLDIGLSQHWSTLVDGLEII